MLLRIIPCWLLVVPLLLLPALQRQSAFALAAHDDHNHHHHHNHEPTETTDDDQNAPGPDQPSVAVAGHQDTRAASSDLIDHRVQLAPQSFQHHPGAATSFQQFSPPRSGPPPQDLSSNLGNHNPFGGLTLDDQGGAVPGASHVRRFPQFQQPGTPGTSDLSAFLSRQPQVISTINNPGGLHSVSWNPPPTLTPPGRPGPFSAPVVRDIDAGRAGNHLVFPGSSAPAIGSGPSRPVAPAVVPDDDRDVRFANIPHSHPEATVFNHRPQPPRDIQPQSFPTPVRGLRGSAFDPPASTIDQTPPTPTTTPVSTSTNTDASTATGPKPKKVTTTNKDDVVVYYYYYYDDDKNGTANGTANSNTAPKDTALDTIPSLDAFDEQPRVSTSSSAATTPLPHSAPQSSHFSFPPITPLTPSTTQLPPVAHPNSLPSSSSSFSPNLSRQNQISPHNLHQPASTSFSSGRDRFRGFHDGFGGASSPFVTPAPAPVRSSTEVSVLVSVSDGVGTAGNGLPVSNVFRYGTSQNSNSRPPFDPFRVGPQFGGPHNGAHSFQPQFPGQAFHSRHPPATPPAGPIQNRFFPTQPTIGAEPRPTTTSFQPSPVNHQPNPNFVRPQSLPPQQSPPPPPPTIDVLREPRVSPILLSRPRETLPPTTVTAAATTTTTTTTTPAPTTTEEPETTTSSTPRSFGSRNRGINRFQSTRNTVLGGGRARDNVLTRARAATTPRTTTTTTTTTTTPRPRITRPPPQRSRPSAAGSRPLRPTFNRGRALPSSTTPLPDSARENDVHEDPAASSVAVSSSSSALPSSAVTQPVTTEPTTTPAPPPSPAPVTPARSRFGSGISRFNNRPNALPRPVQKPTTTTTTTTTQAPSTTRPSLLRRPGSGNRLPTRFSGSGANSPGTSPQRGQRLPFLGRARGASNEDKPTDAGSASAENNSGAGPIAASSGGDQPPNNSANENLSVGDINISAVTESVEAKSAEESSAPAEQPSTSPSPATSTTAAAEPSSTERSLFNRSRPRSSLFGTGRARPGGGLFGRRTTAPAST